MLAMLLPILGPILDGVLSKLVPNVDDRLKYKQEFEKALAENEQKIIDGQIALNLEEAKSPSRWSSGWRPAIGWVCALGLGYTFLIFPFLSWFSAVVLHVGAPPVLASAELMNLVVALLGLGAYRTYEKVKGK